MSDPSPIEARQAALLAHGLARGVGHDWSKVDPEVVETLFALRPELAPPPREGLLDEALDEVLDGPFAVEPDAEELARAAAFAAALEESDPQLEDDLGAAVYALAPGRAPAPSVSIDDILDSVSTGPFAPVIRITGEFPAEIAPPTALRDPETADPEGDNVVSLSARRTAAPPAAAPPTRRATRPAWFLPAMGALAAAAATLLFVVPGVSMHESAPEPALEGAPAARPATAADDSGPRQQAVATSTRDARRSSSAPRARAAPKKKSLSAEKDASATRSPPPPPPPAEKRAEEQAEPKPDAAPVSAGGRADGWAQGGEGRATSERGYGPVEAKREAAPADRAADAEVTDQLESLGYLDSNTAGTANTGYGGMSNTADFSDGDLSLADEAIEEALPEEAELEPAPPEAEAPYAEDGDDDYAWDVDDRTTNTAEPVGGAAPEYAEAEEAMAQAVDGVVLSTEASRKRSRRGVSRAPKASAAAPAAPAPAADAPALDSRDLGLIDPSLAVRRPDLAEIWTTAAQLEARGDVVGAARILSNLAQSQTDADVVVDAAVRSGRLWLTVGNLDRARAALARARQVSPGTSSLSSARSDLARQIESRESRNADRPAGN